MSDVTAVTGAVFARLANARASGGENSGFDTKTINVIKAGARSTTRIRGFWPVMGAVEARRAQKPAQLARPPGRLLRRFAFPAILTMIRGAYAQVLRAFGILRVDFALKTPERGRLCARIGRNMRMGSGPTNTHRTARK